MKYVIYIGLLIFCVLKLYAQEKFAKNDLQILNEKLTHLNPDPSKVLETINFQFQRDVGRFNLHNGKIYFCQPLNNRVCAGLFLGNGTFEMIPPIKVEREHLSRVYQTEEIQKPFTSMFFVFLDSTYDDWSKKLPIRADRAEEISGEVDDYIQSYMKYYTDDKGDVITASNFEILFNLANNTQNGFFAAAMSNKTATELSSRLIASTDWSRDPLFYKFDPDALEEVQLSRRDGSDRFQFTTEYVSMFHHKSYFDTPSYLNYKRKYFYSIDNYVINSVFDEKLKSSHIAEFEVRPLKKDLLWIFFDLYPKLEVDSVFCNGINVEYACWNNSKTPYSELREKGGLWIKTDYNYKSNKTVTLRVYYHGEFIERVNNDFYMKTSTGWYPTAPAYRREKYLFDLTFNIPSIYKTVSVGDKLSEKTSKSKTITHWVTKKPIHSGAFNIGFFGHYEIKDKRIPNVYVKMSEADHADIGRSMIAEGFGTGKDMEKQVGADVANSMAFFQDVYGPCVSQELYVTEVPYAHGVAFPGLIHLWWGTFQRTGESGSSESFRAHEVAHQWWGVGVDCDTYHDRWLAEAFAEYSGLWYMQYALKDNKKFFKFLKNYKEDILKNRNSLFDKIVGDDQQAGPIWLGYRTGSSSSEGDYGLIIYEKGAWVLHMLRNMMLDLNTMDEERFKNMMRDFYQSYVGKHASTENFKQTVEKHFGTDMTWFFDQWVYGTDIPKYEIAYKILPAENGKYKIRCQVKQLNVSEDFKMLIPVTIDLGENRYVRLRIMVQDKGGEFDLPAMPLEPKKITFNDFESVLCEVEYTNWKN